LWGPGKKGETTPREKGRIFAWMGTNARKRDGNGYHLEKGGPFLKFTEKGRGGEKKVQFLKQRTRSKRGGKKPVLTRK